MQPWQDKEIEATRKKYTQFALEHLDSEWDRRDLEKEFSLQRWKQCCDFGVTGLSMPEIYGGQNKPYGHTVAAIEGLSKGCRDTGFFFAMSSQISGIQLALVATASDALKQKYMPALISGEKLACLGFTEESGGSDIYATTTSAEKVDGGYILRGGKDFITNSVDSNCGLVFAKTKHEGSPFDFSAFMFDFDQDGVSHGDPVNKAVFKTCSMGRIRFDEVFIADDHLVGGVGGGLNVIKYSIGWERVILLATCLGPMARILEDTIEQARHREQYGEKIGQFQQVSSKIADMIMRLNLCRQTVYDLCGQLTANKGKIGRVIEQIAISKLFVTESYIEFMRDATQVWGARGVCHEWPIHQAMRDSLGSTIWAGTSETLRNTIAKMSGV